MTTCRVCAGIFHRIERRIYPVDRLEAWRDLSVCDRCATEALDKDRLVWDRWRRRTELRELRKTKRRARCLECTEQFWFPRGGKWPTLCPKCAARHRTCPVCKTAFETDSPEQKTCGFDCLCKLGASAWWDELPKAYRATRADRLPCADASDYVIRWEPCDKPGLFCFGASGVGKTRSALLRLRRFMEEGYDILYLRSAEFARETIERSRPGGSGGAAQWLDHLRAVEVLCLDEVEKLKFSERVEAEFFDLVECRLSNALATIFVGNVPPSCIAERMGASYAEAFHRRIVEFCSAVSFERPRNPREKSPPQAPR